MNSSRIAFNLRKRIARFSGNVSLGLCLRAQSFVGDMVYGIGACQSVLLSKVGRPLEEGIALIRTEGRVSRNLQRPALEAALQDNVLRTSTTKGCASWRNASRTQPSASSACPISSTTPCQTA